MLPLPFRNSPLLNLLQLGYVFHLHIFTINMRVMTQIICAIFSMLLDVYRSPYMPEYGPA